MKTSKVVVALASLALLASCGGNSSTPTQSSEPAADVSSTVAKKTMAFLEDGYFRIDVPTSVLAYEETGKKPSIKINGTGVEGDRTDKLEGQFALSAVGTFAQDLYLTIARSDQEGHISARAYGPIEKDKVNEFLTALTSSSVPNKVYVAFSVTKATWVTGLDEEMDQEIQAAWTLVS